MQDWDSQNASQIVTELCGFITILSGTFLLHKTKDMGNDSPIDATVFSTSKTPSPNPKVNPSPTSWSGKESSLVVSFPSKFDYDNSGEYNQRRAEGDAYFHPFSKEDLFSPLFRQDHIQ